MITKPKILFLLSTIFLMGGISLANELDDHRVQLESELAGLYEQMEEMGGLIRKKQMESTTFESEIAILNYQINKARLGIRARNLVVGELSDGIKEGSSLIVELEKKTDTQKISLAEFLRRVNEMDSTSLVEIVLGYDTISEFLEDFNSFESIQRELQVSLSDIRNTQKETEEEIQDLETKKLEEMELRYIQELEKKKLEQKEFQKQELLKITKGEETRYQELLEETRETAAEIRARIFRLFGGGELTFGEAVTIAQFAEQASGIRAAFILAILSQESAIDGIIGRNLGQCYYNTPANNKSGTVMRNSEKSSFLAIMREIEMNPETTPVSCPIVSAGEHGGAMGPAQFMPTTWWNIETQTGYKKRVSKITGNNPPSPFNNSDAFVGTSLYLKDAYNSNSCIKYKDDACRDYGLCDVTEARILLERCAASKYFAGGNWYDWRWWYGEPVVERAGEYQKQIDIISK